LFKNIDEIGFASNGKGGILATEFVDAIQSLMYDVTSKRLYAEHQRKLAEQNATKEAKALKLREQVGLMIDYLYFYFIIFDINLITNVSFRHRSSCARCARSFC
jgi:hypothetical protein